MVLYFALEIVGTGVKEEKDETSRSRWRKEGRTDEWGKDRGKKKERGRRVAEGRRWARANGGYIRISLFPWSSPVHSTRNANAITIRCAALECVNGTSSIMGSIKALYCLRSYCTGRVNSSRRRRGFWAESDTYQNTYRSPLIDSSHSFDLRSVILLRISVCM